MKAKRSEPAPPKGVHTKPTDPHSTPVARRSSVPLATSAAPSSVPPRGNLRSREACHLLGDTQAVRGGARTEPAAGWSEGRTGTAPVRSAASTPVSPGTRPVPPPEHHSLPITTQTQGSGDPLWGQLPLPGGLALTVLGMCRQPRRSGSQKVGHAGEGDGRCGLKTVRPPSAPPGRQSRGGRSPQMTLETPGADPLGWGEARPACRGEASPNVARSSFLLSVLEGWPPDTREGQPR